jgi:hypothetical protein
MGEEILLAAAGVDILVDFQGSCADIFMADIP